MLAEQFIAGRELTAAILNDEALPLIRIEAPQGNYDYQNKYFTDDTRYECPAPIPADVAAKVQSLVVQAYRGLGCRGWGRADIMLRKSDNAPFLLEMNTSPGTSTRPMAFIFFLPSFCFSSSLRLREMSPP